ncbi:hypothetical protein Tco_0628930 [Tanacetum coccineum]|uniref:RNA-directed DNA polymerase from mobile element jockey-like n=1 Tax=Tanacetum coccineum TaxID=301880 RepID=A0ABQ4WRW4_9ASTR
MSSSQIQASWISLYVANGLLESTNTVQSLASWIASWSLNNFVDKLPQANLNALTSEFSDHSPLILTNRLLDYGPIPLKTVLLKIKLQGLKACLKNWRQTVRLAESASAVTLHARLDQLDLLAESGPLSSNNIEIRTNIIKDLMCLENRLIKDLKQKAKCKWAKEGDENSGFFHGIINSRLNRSRLNGLNILGSWVTDPPSIKDHIFYVFESKFKETNLSRPTSSSNLFKHLSLEDITFLDRPFSNQEIKDAV